MARQKAVYEVVRANPESKLYTSPDGGSVRVTRSPVNQTWFLVWPGDAPVEEQQVLGLFRTWEEADREAKRITSGAAENPTHDISRAQVARREQVLDRLMRTSDGRTLKVREFLNQLRTQGGTLKTFIKRNYDREDEIRRQIERLGRNVPFGNPNHPDTKRFYAEKARLEASLMKSETGVVLPDGKFFPLNKTELEYWTALPPPPDESHVTLEQTVTENPRLTAARRHDLPSSAFALPERRELPIEDAAHIRNAAARLSMMRNEGHVTKAEYVAAHRRIVAAGRKHGVEIR